MHVLVVGIQTAAEVWAQSDLVTLWLAISGIAGTFIRACASTTQKTRSRQTLVDLAIGFAVGGLYPLFFPLPLPEGATVFQRCLFVFLASVTASWAKATILHRTAGKGGKVR